MTDLADAMLVNNARVMGSLRDAGTNAGRMPDIE